MSASRHFGALQIRGLLKTGDFYLPGGPDFPRFSDTPYVFEVDRIADAMSPADRRDLGTLLSLFALLPAGAVGWVLGLAERSYRSSAPGAAFLRQVAIGLKGIVMSLYYSDVGSDGEVQRGIGWDTRCGTAEASSPEAAAFAAARSGQPLLRRLGARDRLKYISRLKEVILRRQEEILDRVQKDTGKSRTDALLSEIFGVLDHLAYLEKFAVRHLSDRKVHTPPVLMGKKSLVYFEPMGTVLIISPWNYPFYQAIVPITLALVCGNTVVYKPSEHTPLRGLLEGLLKEAGILANWVQVVYGEGATGQALIAQKPNKIFFTGSTRTGKRIMEQASKDLIPVELELGGKDPMIVFADVNVGRAAAGAAWGALTNTGQSCTSVERVFVQESIYDPFKKELLAEVQRIRQAVDSDGSADIGVMTNDMQVAVVARQLDDALKKGAVQLSGKDWDRRSRVIPPIVLEAITPEMEIYSEETFGPLIPLIPFATEDEVVQKANDTRYGLSASVWSADLRRADRVARALVTGNVSINNVMLTEGNHALPFGGVGESGFGRFKGEFGFYSFSNIKSILADKNSKKIEANWYPYHPTKYRLFQDLIRATFSGGPLALVRFALAGLRLESCAQKRTRTP